MKLTKNQLAEVNRVVETVRDFMMRRGKTCRGYRWLRVTKRGQAFDPCSPLIRDSVYFPRMERTKPLYLLAEVRKSGFMVGIPDPVARQLLYRLGLSCHGSKKKWNGQLDDILAEMLDESANELDIPAESLYLAEVRLGRA